MELELATNGMFDDPIYDFGGEYDDGALDTERCGICMDGIVDRGVLDCCDHWFCFACIDNWATITNLCPLCQNEFQMITCVPVYDTIGGGKVEDDSLSRDEDWSVQGTNNTVSFPSYYIDENAVICLDGDGCKIRSGVETAGDDSVLDTSIACDSCDIWYHAFCVDFDPESTSESSWLCPRCIDEVPEKSVGVSVQTANDRNNPEISSHEQSVEASQCGKVSVSVADAGETAVVVSMIDGDHWLKGPSENSLSDKFINTNYETLDSKSKTQSQVDAEEKSLGLSLSHDTHFTVDPVDLNALRTNLADEAVPEPIVSDGCQQFTGLISDESIVEGEPSKIESGISLQLGLFMGPTFEGDKLNSDATANKKIEASQPHDFCKDLSLSGFIQADNMAVENNEDSGGPSCVKRKSISPMSPKNQEGHDLVAGHKEIDNIDPMHEMTASTPAKKAKRDIKSQKTLHKDESTGHKEVDNIEPTHEMTASPPAKKAKGDIKSQKTSHKDESRKIVPESSTDEVGKSDTIPQMAADPPPKKAKGDRQYEQKSRKDEIRKDISEGNSQECSGSKDEVVAKVPAKRAKIDGKLDQTHSKSIKKDDKLRNVPAKQATKTPDIMSIVRAANRRQPSGGLTRPNLATPSTEKDNGSGLRVKKIMRRASEDESSKAVENLRKEIREAVRSKATQDTSKPKVFDPELLLAFRNALAGTRSENDPPKKLDPSAIRAKRLMLQKGKARESLTKKIYGNSNGRRKRAWDRDWEVEFWKHRCNRASKPEKVDTLTSVLNLLKKKSESSEIENEPDKENENEKDGPNPILSRLYLADSSVFPRTDDIKPVSALTTPGNEKFSKPLNENRTSQPSQIPKNSSQCSTNKKNTTPMEPSPKEMPIKSEVKTDKRKWALEVLARKTTPTTTVQTQGKTDDNTMLKGNFSLLAQLPADMRPVLAPSRHNKVPVSVRQAQLHRLTEHFLRKADVPVSRRSADTELAVADAINTEKEIIDKSNSKIVYLNLISQYIKNNNKPEPEPSSPPIDPPPKPESQPSSQPVDPPPKEDEEALRMAGLLDDSPPNSPSEKEPDNIFDIETHTDLDIYGDFEYDLENDDFIGGVLPKVSKPQVEDSDSKMKVIFSTLSTLKENDDPIELVPLDAKTMDSSLPSDPLLDKVIGEISLAEECEELYGPDKEPMVIQFPESWGEKTLVASGLVEKSSNGSSTSISRKEKSTNKKKQSDITHSVTKKVETYIKEHIRPLCKSGVITVDQYRYAVEKTTVKIMKYHSKDTNANFLIKEGEKVKKLAEQYVEAAQKKDSS